MREPTDASASRNPSREAAEGPGRGSRWPTILSYGLGDFSIGVMWGAVVGYLMYFLTEVCLLTAREVGVIMLTARLIGVAGDVFVGVLVDRRPDGSRARPFLKYGGVLFPVFFFLTFLPLPAGHHQLQFLWSFVALTGLTLSNAALSTPYSVMLNLITEDTRLRIRLSTSRTIGASIGVFASAGFIPLADLLGAGNRKLGVPYAVGLGALVILVSLLTLARNCRERMTGHMHASGLLDGLRKLARDREWIVVTLSMIFNIIGITLLFGSVTYYAKYALGLSDYYGVLLGLLSNVAVLAGSAAAEPFLERLPLTLSLGVSGVLGGLPILVLYGLPAGLPAAIVAYGVSGLFLGVWSSVSYAILAEATEAGEPGKAANALGVPYALNNALIKGGTSLGGSFLAFTMAGAGFVSGAATQSADAVHGIVRAACLLPAAAFILSGAVAALYPRAPKTART
ncbi:MFS transporter [Caulobacter sp. KR2-114]|uniref:MFS transporter n=1 Tax=Caulobacter sp. KR2-114 TaxID=3400912 RepID=UPI003C02FEEA